MKTKLFTLSILTALLFVGCDNQDNSNSNSPSTEPPIAIDVIAPAVADQMVAIVGDKFIKVGEVRYDAPADIYHVEVFCEDDEKNEKRLVMELVKRISSNTPNLLSYRSDYPVGLARLVRKDVEVPSFIQVDKMMDKKVSSTAPSSEKPNLKEIVAPGQTIEDVKKHLGEPSSVVTEEDGRIVMTYTAAHDLMAAARSGEVQISYSGTVIFKDGVVESSKNMQASEIRGSMN